MPLADQPFAYRATAGGEVRIERGGRLVTILRGAGAAAFLRKVADATEGERQQAMARVTGNYRRGNERSAAGHARRRPG